MRNKDHSFTTTAKSSKNGIRKKGFPDMSIN